MTNSEVFIGSETIALAGKTTHARTLVELKVLGEVVLSKYYYFIHFGEAHYKFCKKFINEIEQYDGGKDLLKIVLQYEYNYENKNIDKYEIIK